MRTVTISFKPYMVCEYKHNGRIITNQKKYLTVFDYQGYICNRNRDIDVPHRTPTDVIHSIFEPFEIHNLYVVYETLPYITIDIEIVIDDNFNNIVLNNNNENEEDKIRNYFINKYSEYVNDNYGVVTLSENVKNNFQNIIKLLFSWIEDNGDGENDITDIYLCVTFKRILNFHNYE